MNSSFSNGGTKKYNVIILGSGSSGVRLARRLAQAGKSVALIGKQNIGGTCVNLGCIPKKLFANIARLLSYSKRGKRFTWNSSPVEFNWSEILQFKVNYINRLKEMYAHNLQNASVDLYEGYGKFLDKQTIEVDNGNKTEILTAKNIVIAIGTKPALLDIPGKEHLSTSDNLFSLQQLPKRCLIIGMGYIAVETASFLNSMGSEVTMAQQNHTCLSTFDSDLAERLCNTLQAQGIKCVWNVNLTNVKKTGEDLQCTLSNGSQMSVDKVFVAIGRIPNMDHVSFAGLNLKTDAKGFISVDKNYRTSEDNIFALGDVIGGIQLTPVAIKQAEILSEYLINGHSTSSISEFVPTAVFTDPQIASVGVSDTLISEEQKSKLMVRQKEYVSIQESCFGQPFKTFIKIVCEKETERVVGLHMMNNDAAEIVQAFAPLLDMHVTLKQLDKCVRLHPTVAEDLLSW